MSSWALWLLPSGCAGLGPAKRIVRRVFKPTSLLSTPPEGGGFKLDTVNQCNGSRAPRKWRGSGEAVPQSFSPEIAVIHSHPSVPGVVPKNSQVQDAFKNSMTHGYLRFALRIAFRCVLHRSGSRDIHKSEAKRS